MPHKSNYNYIPPEHLSFVKALNMKRDYNVVREESRVQDKLVQQTNEIKKRRTYSSAQVFYVNRKKEKESAKGPYASCKFDAQKHATISGMIGKPIIDYINYCDN